MSDEIDDLVTAMREHAEEAWENRNEPGMTALGASETRWFFNRAADWIDNVWKKEHQ